MKKYISLICITLIISSCQEKSDNINNTPEEKQFVIEDTQYNDSYSRKVYFAKILAKAMVDEDVRQFIKDRSLTMFDNDYDILYALEKEKTLPSGKTFEKTLCSYADSEEIFKKNIAEEPLLTIYVPELEQWNADAWNISNEIPIVAIRNEKEIKSKSNIIAYNSEEIQISLSYTEKPTSPVIVVKENERVILQNPINRSNIISKLFVINTEKGDLQFISENFSNKESSSTRASSGAIGFSTASEFRSYPPYFWGAPIKTAYNGYLNTPESPRDYIYYGISPSNGVNSGPFSNGASEVIVGLYVNDTYSKDFIVDGTDWTDGRLDFIIDIFFIAGKEGGLTSLRKGFSCPPEKLFYGSDTRIFYLPSPIDIVPWDMEKYGDTWKIHVYEYDPGTQIKNTTTLSSTFSSNFEAEVGVDLFEIVKIGVGGGNSSSETRTQSIETTITDTSDDLAEAILSFSDPIQILWYGSYGKFKAANTGYVTVLIAPMKNPPVANWYEDCWE